MPFFTMESVKNFAAGSAQRPPSTILRPMCIRPLRNVPAVIITAFAWNTISQIVRTPTTRSCSTKSSVTSSCQMWRLGVCSKRSRIVKLYCIRSHCARGLHIAGPLERLSIRNCIVAKSVISPINPPRASISRTICPLAIPPIAGLQLICAILFISIVMRHVFAPIVAAAYAASQPAWPAPITKTS